MTSGVAWGCKHPLCPRRFDSREAAKHHHQRVHEGVIPDQERQA